MQKKIMFIDDKPSFIVRTIFENLKNAGYECVMFPMDIDTINHETEAVDMFFINLCEEHKSNPEFFVFLRDLCVEKEKSAFFVGYPEELAFVQLIIPNEYIGGAFQRPIDARQIVEEINKAAAEENELFKQKHILVVDDSGEMLRTVKSWLSDKYRVSMANSAVNAISFLSNNTPDLILLDYEMPVCSGPQMLEMIRSEVKTESIPVMFLTGKSDAESVKAVLSLKPQGYILKSHTPEQILETIDNFFASHKKII